MREKYSIVKFLERATVDWMAECQKGRDFKRKPTREDVIINGAYFLLLSWLDYYTIRRV